MDLSIKKVVVFEMKPSRSTRGFGTSAFRCFILVNITLITVVLLKSLTTGVLHSTSRMEEDPELLWGMEEGLIYGLVFDNVTIGNQTVDSVNFFHHNQYVFDDLNIY